MVRKSKKNNDKFSLEDIALPFPDMTSFHKDIILQEDILPQDLYAQVYDEDRALININGDDDNTHVIMDYFNTHLEPLWQSIKLHYIKKRESKNISSDKIYTKEEYKNNMKAMREMIENNEKNHFLTLAEQKMFKKPWERLVDFLDFKHTNYIFYPITTDSEFNKKIYQKKEFQINKQAEINVDKFEDIQEELCPNKNKNFNLQSHQKLIKSYLSHNTYYNGLLIFHGTGTGKTCSSITIAESYKTLVAENSKKVLVILSKSVKSNFIREIHDVARGYNQCTGADYLNYEFFSSMDKKKKSVLSLIDKYYDLMTFGKFRNEIIKELETYSIDKYQFNQPIPAALIKWIDLIFSNRVIIVDEVHNLKKYKTDKDEEITLEKYEDDEDISENSVKKIKDFKPYDALELILKYSRNVKLVMLSATPMYHKPREIISLFNLLLINDDYDRIDVADIFENDNIKDEESRNTLRIISQGYVSYVRTENPYTFAKRHYPDSEPIHSFVNNKIEKLKKIYKIKKTIRNNNYSDIIKVIPCEMSVKHDKFYKLRITAGDMLTKLIQYGNYGVLDVDRISQKKLILSELLDKEKSISCKLGKLIYNILHNISNGTYFIFSYYIKHGTQVLAQALLANGISLVVVNSNGKIVFADAKTIKGLLGHSYNQPTKDEQICYKDGKKRSEYKNNMHEFKPMTFVCIIGKIEENVRDNIITAFNSDSNKYGLDIKIMLGSSVFKEGISLLNVRQIHILEPWHNRSRIEQVIGRGIRHCSHRQLLPSERNVNIYQYISTYNTSVDNNAYDGNIDRKEIKSFIKPFSGNVISNVSLVSSNMAKLNILHYDVIMYMRSQILNNLIIDVQSVLKETAMDCLFNREINVNTLKPEDRYQCMKKITFDEDDEDDIGEIEYFTKQDMELKDDEIDYSTFDDIFYQPYVIYVINLIKTKFESNEGIYILNFEDIINDSNLIDNPIYTEKNYYIIRAALYSLIPSTKNKKINILKKKIGRGFIYGYIFGRNTSSGGMFIFQPFEEQSNVHDISKKQMRSDFERSPMYEKTGFEQAVAVPTSLSEIDESKYIEIVHGKKPRTELDVIDVSKITKRKVKKVTELIKELDVSISDENEKLKNAPLIGLILNIQSLANHNKSSHLWGQPKYHIWLREKKMICKEGKRESFGQFSLSYNLSQLKCIIQTYILTEEFRSLIDSSRIITLIRETTDKKAIKFADDIAKYDDIYEWWNLRVTKPKGFKLVLKKQDVANLLYIILKYFEEINNSNKIWIRVLTL
jgi:superfamily II DNA or RNA helicase|tara:strand:+ start:19420 stop:23229 length:3810 start_codon:yes stop_codon:yes gene_type:complete